MQQNLLSIHRVISSFLPPPEIHIKIWRIIWISAIIRIYTLLSALLELDIVERGKKFMKQRKKIKYTDEHIGKIKIIPDFLPSPDELAPKEETVKVTLFLSRFSVDFFKHLAEKKHTRYQKMIRILLDMYASHFS